MRYFNNKPKKEHEAAKKLKRPKTKKEFMRLLETAPNTLYASKQMEAWQELFDWNDPRKK